MLRMLTAGESHGPCLTAIVEGMPAGCPIDVGEINRHLARRQRGYGRGGRMRIERDEVRITSGVRWGVTLGSPVTLVIENRDWKNWRRKMSVDPADRDDSIRVTRPRPGHADLVGALKYGHEDVRNVLERASARETAARVAVGSLARQLIEPFGVRIYGTVREIGGIRVEFGERSIEEIFEASERSPLCMADPDAERRAIALIDECKREGDTLGGVVEVHAVGLPPGLGSHVHWDRKVDGRIAGALMSVQAVKGIEIGAGFRAAAARGSQIHDEIVRTADGIGRASNNYGGTEGGMTTGEPLVVRVAFKPISTLMRPLRSVDLATGQETRAAVERSDVVAVPAAAVICEAVVAYELARLFLEKFGGDSFAELRRNYQAYLREVRERVR
ncbi:MAG: chorismate synthase [Candidatus Dadabacteria bacterium]|nr:MAG: chorismate synthase [Candidatus Dadabacteria bacterium]